jgi:hypothetical protein
MYTQLSYLIAQQHHQDLIQNAERERLAAQLKPTRRARHQLKPLNRVWAWITSTGAQATPADTRSAP